MFYSTSSESSCLVSKPRKAKCCVCNVFQFQMNHRDTYTRVPKPMSSLPYKKLTSYKDELN